MQKLKHVDTLEAKKAYLNGENVVDFLKKTNGSSWLYKKYRWSG